MKRVAVGSISIFFLMLTTSGYAVGTNFSVDLKSGNDIPALCQVDYYMCGPAVGQMALQGYPGNVNHVLDQPQLYGKINSFNNDPPVIWWTEPSGLQKTLMHFGGDPGVNWRVHAETDPDVLMHDIAYWIVNRGFPVPVVTDKGGHWVLITGFESDVAPIVGNTIQLVSVFINEPDIAYPTQSPCPYPEYGGVAVTVLASTWSFSSAYYWNGPVTAANSRWNGKYVAVIEPPSGTGYARSGKQKDSGTIIAPSVAADAARAWLDQADTSDKSRYKTLRYSQVQNPMLVNAKNHAYYIVPLGAKGSEGSDGAILVNAYSAELQEIAVFPHVRKYLSEKDALLVLLSYTSAKSSDVQQDGELFFQSSDQAQTRLFPLWKFIVYGKPYYISQSERAYKLLTRERLGN